MIAADSSLIADVALDDEPTPARSVARRLSPDITSSSEEIAAVGSTRWASPPPGLNRNWVYLTQLGLLLAVGVLLFGARAVGG